MQGYTLMCANGPLAATCPGSRRRRRRGTLTVELMWVFPLLAILLFGMIQMTAQLDARRQVAGASREGARVAALGGALQDVQATVQRHLDGGRLSGAQVTLTQGTQPFSPID